MTAPVPTNPLFNALSGFPPWLVVACTALVAATLLWLLSRIIKWVLWFLAIAVLVVGGGIAIWLLVAR